MIGRLLFIGLWLFPLCILGQNGTWEWVTGTNNNFAIPVYGTIGIPSTSNTPPALRQAVSWTDLQGNFWLFGGEGNINSIFHAVLWKFNPLTLEWTYMNGDTTNNASGVYGTQTVAAATNHPGARATGPASWIDLQGNLWLFGGDGYDATGAYGDLGDLWKYDISTNMWTWMNGSNLANSSGNYGTYQIPAATNEPPPRASSTAAWVSTNGDLWMYGGRPNGPDLNAVWRYNISTNMWTWMAGSTTPVPINYGTQFVSSPSNTPGGRMVHAHWTDTNGKFWMLGGSNGLALADLWKFDPMTNEWTWMGGSNSSSAAGTFTQQCQSGGYPSARSENSACWTDACGRFWGFGGVDSFINSYDDLWMFDPTTISFKWITNSTALYQAGVWGTQGIPSTSNHPASMLGSVAFSDLQGNLWMFGGYMSTLYETYNTLWKYTPDPSCVNSNIPNVITNVSSNLGCVPFTAQFSSSAATGVTYQWNFGDPSVTSDTSSFANPSYTYTNAGTFTVTLIVTSSTPCSIGQSTTTINITVNAFPVANAGADQQICFGDSLQLNATGGTTYSWSPSNGLNDSTIANPIASPQQTTNYVVSINNGVCYDQDSVTVFVHSLPTLLLSNNTTIEPGDTVQLSASGGLNYQWYPSIGLSCSNCSNPIASPTVTTNYCVTATDSIGCSQTSCTEIRVELNCGELFVPNAFSPNEDGQNDVLYVRFKPGCYTLIQFSVYDRWGEKVFETNDPSIGWNGFLNGQKSTVAVYVYEVDAIRKDGVHELRKGNVSLIR